MNRQMYLVELGRLLVFMDEEDREEAVRRCAAAFEAVGPAGEEALADEMGSPTRLAIALSRGYEPGRVPNVFSGFLAAVPVPPAEEIPAAPPEGVDPVGPAWEELPDYAPPPLGESDAPEAAGPSPRGEVPLPAEGVPGEEFLPGETSVDPALLTDDPAWEQPWEEGAWGEEPASYVVRSMPLGLGIPLFVLVFAALGLPLAVICLALCLAVLSPGAAVLGGAALTMLGGLWCLDFMADAVLLFGLAFMVLAVGLVVLWLGLCLAVGLVRLYGRGTAWLAGELLGRRVRTDA